MQTPTVHLNGTSGQSLADAYDNAVQAVREAIRLVQATAPHGRDYYTRGKAAYGLAAEEHRVRLAGLERCEDELVELRDCVLEQSLRRST